jgi:hypothetical protein
MKQREADGVNEFGVNFPARPDATQGTRSPLTKVPHNELQYARPWHDAEV